MNCFPCIKTSLVFQIFRAKEKKTPKVIGENGEIIDFWKFHFHRIGGWVFMVEMHTVDDDGRDIRR